MPDSAPEAARVDWGDMNQHDSQQAQYFGKAKYRSPEDPVVEAYATPKVSYILESIDLSRESRILDLACCGPRSGP